MFGKCPESGYGLVGPTGDSRALSHVSLVSAMAQGRRVEPSGAAPPYGWPSVRFTAGQKVAVTLKWPRSDAGERVVLFWQPQDVATEPLQPLAWARIAADGEATFTWTAAPGNSVVHAYGYGTDGGVLGGRSRVIFQLRVKAPAVTIPQVPTGPAQ